MTTQEIPNTVIPSKLPSDIFNFVTLRKKSEGGGGEAFTFSFVLIAPHFNVKTLAILSTCLIITYFSPLSFPPFHFSIHSLNLYRLTSIYKQFKMGYNN